MSSFGELLRKFRNKCNDPHSPRGRLSQERLGALIGEDMGIRFSGAAVSDWERGASKIHADQRAVLISLTKILYRQGGLKTLAEANELLDAGNYRALNSVEKLQVFSGELMDLPDQPLPSQPNDRQRISVSFLEQIFFDANEGLQNLWAEAKEGPAPSWPRVLAVLLRKSLDRLSPKHAIRAILWLWLWSLAWVLIAPSLRWPFSSEEDVWFAMWLYVAGSLAVPLLIGLLTSTADNPFWQKDSSNTAKRILRLYTYQGAGIGFHLGYFAGFFIGLIRYNFHLAPAIWFELAATVFPLVTGYAGARLVPYNLRRAYGRLNLADGGVFFIFLILGPIWGVLFFGFHNILLTPVLGILVVLSAITALVTMMALQHHRSGTTVIPIHWWTILYGSILVLYEMSTVKDIYSIVSLAGWIAFLSTLIAWERIRLTLPGALGLAFSIILLQIAPSSNVWMIILIVGALTVIWQRWGKKHLWFPPVFWILGVIYVGCSWGLHQQWWPGITASLIFGAGIVLVLWWEHRHHRRKY